jgi:hypothetical protein
VSLTNFTIYIGAALLVKTLLEFQPTIKHFFYSTFTTF